MDPWIGLLRGINVGGHGRLPMGTLRDDLRALGLTQVRTYIQSGNVVFGAADATATDLEEAIASHIEARHGFRPSVVVRSLDAVRAAVAANPFPEAVASPATLHFFFLAEPAVAPDRARLEAARSPTEAYRLTEPVFYLHAPGGIGRSRLAAQAERHLGVAATARNYRTVARLVALAEAGP